MKIWGLLRSWTVTWSNKALLSNFLTAPLPSELTMFAILTSSLARVYQVNKALVQHIKELYQLYQRSEMDPLFVQMFTWTGNTGAILTVKVNDSFKPADLNNLELPMETAGVEAASVNPSPSVSSGIAAPPAMRAQTTSATIAPATSPGPSGEPPPPPTGKP
jgi:hypothetical protein